MIHRLRPTPEAGCGTIQAFRSSIPAGLTPGLVLSLAMVAGGCSPKGESTPSPSPATNAARNAGEVNQPGDQVPVPVAEAAAPAASATPVLAQPEAPTDDRFVLDLTMTRIDGQSEPLSDYRGKVVLVVNVASACGLTPQYEGLQALYERREGDGLVILGFPANNFGNQEPGTNKEILEFCTGRFDVSFPMFEKISVVGADQHPLYQRLSQEGGPPTWNFTKYLVDRSGRVVARFDPRTRPDDPALLARIDELLAQ